MRANCWISRNTVRVENVPDPSILNRRDAIVKITSTAICGSDLHLLDGYVPTMQKGDIMGHEFMGEVVEVGPGVDREKLAVGDRVVVPFPIACGACAACRAELYSLCENTNPNAGMAEKLFGHPTAGIFGYSHLTGGFAGGQAEYARVPFADVGPLKVEGGLADEQVLFLSDIFPTGYMGAEVCDITAGRRRGGVGRRSGRAVRDGQRAYPRRVEGHRHRPGCPIASRWPSGPVRPRSTSKTSTCEALPRSPAVAGPTPASTPSAWKPATARAHVRLRSRQAGDAAGDRPPGCAARGHHGLPQRRHRVGDRRLRRLHRQVPNRRVHEPVADLRTGQCHVQRYLRPLWNASGAATSIPAS